ncbi:nucleotidyltransferase domain-containing protein [Deferribacter thermophilus]|uniref:Polymerase nucleotidyl transferase domain-containing protein n=1 Tax=Deferribacter desulfuricans (strain DSM 14783 / JCM 11476 / NBRC 101012 / SSM1) TaxID=639282 RepID=D3P9S9_DEFDS|nr:nucleotidyltransferase domain-containing protein [Deferribacter desulfuricans]BAI81469.1 conserved hypothetical protein [Deferribacter desulfuricans SSM1]
MNKELIEKLKKLKPVLKEKFGIEEFAVFGSQVRDDFHKNSDIDIVLIKVAKKDYFNRLKAKYFLEKVLNVKVDLGYYDSMREIIKEEISKDIFYV